MEIAEAKEFLKDKHHGVLVARKKDGSLQMTLVSPVIGSDGNLIIPPQYWQVNDLPGIPSRK